MNCLILKCNFEVFNVVLKNPNFSIGIFKTLHDIHQWLLGKSRRDSSGIFRNGKMILKRRQALEIVR